MAVISSTTYITHCSVTIIIFLIAAILSHNTNSLPISIPSKKSSKSFSGEDIDYLARFGYLPQTGSQAYTSIDQLKDAIRNLQFTARINVTGELDSETVELMKKPRCGVPDVAHAGYRNKRSLGLTRVKRYNLQGQRWSKTNLTWNIRLGPTRYSYDAVRQEISLALDMWAKETRLTFQEVSPQARADLEIYFFRGEHGDGYPFDGSGSILAHAFFPGSGRGGDVHFDDDERWSKERIINKEVTSIFAVAVHEFGHSLGLSHSSVEGSLMFPWYSGVPQDLHLPKDDLNAIRQLYGTVLPQYPTYDQGRVQEKDSINTTRSNDGQRHGQNDTKVIPDKCETDFDAVATIRSEMWVFKGRYFWRIDKNGGTREDPINLASFWYGLPEDIDHVDAVYERPDHKIIFFVGDQYYVMTGNSQLEEGPIPITRLGLSESVKKLDGAMVWGWNQKTYFFSG